MVEQHLDLGKKLTGVLQEGMQAISDNITKAKVILKDSLELPYAYVTCDILANTSAMSKFCCQCLLLQQSLEAYTAKRDEFNKGLARLKKSSFRRKSMSSGLPGNTQTSVSLQRAALCDVYCKMQIRLAQLISTYEDCLFDINTYQGLKDTVDFSMEASKAFVAIHQTLTEPISSISLDSASVTEAQAEHVLLENLQAGNFAQAVALLRGTVKSLALSFPLHSRLSRFPKRSFERFFRSE